METIKNEYTFSMNSIVFSLESTNFYGIQDEYVYEKVKNKLDEISSIKKVYISNSVSRLYLSSKEKIVYNLDYLSHKYNKKKLFTKFSDNIDKVVYYGYSITYSLIQFAVYMEFKEIYLLGCDCNYLGPKTHAVDYGLDDPEKEFLAARMTKGYEVAKEYCDKNGIKIFNATRDGMLEVFPRIILDDVLKNKEIREK